MRRSLLVLSFLGLGQVLAGCGDDGGDGNMAGMSGTMPTLGTAGAGQGTPNPTMGTAGTNPGTPNPTMGTAGTNPTTGTAGMTGTSMTGTAGTNPMTGTAGMTGAAGMTGTAGMGGATGQPTWSAIYTEIIVGQGCNGGALCHGGAPGATGGNLSLMTQEGAHAALVNQPAMAMWIDPRIEPKGPVANCADTGATRVIPGQPEMSLLYTKISQDPPPCGDPMPQSGMLTAAQIEQIRQWIAMGAMNN